jgi:hypothetical protein
VTEIHFADVVEAFKSSQHNHWNRALETDCTSILLITIFSILNSWETQQLQAKLIRSKWVYKTQHNLGGSTQYKEQLVIKVYEQMYFCETLAHVGKLPTLQYIIAFIGRFRWYINHWHVVTAF